MKSVISKLTPQELIELTHAQELPAWTMLKVRDPIVGWRAFTAHEICVLNEIFMLVIDDPECKDVYRKIGISLGLLSDESDDDE